MRSTCGRRCSTRAIWRSHTIRSTRTCTSASGTWKRPATESRRSSPEVVPPRGPGSTRSHVVAAQHEAGRGGLRDRLALLIDYIAFDVADIPAAIDHARLGAQQRLPDGPEEI